MLCINTNFLLGNLWFCVILAKKSNNMKKHSFICQKALKTQGMQYMQIISYFISNILPWNTHFTISGKYDHWQKTCNCINFPALVITKEMTPFLYALFCIFHRFWLPSHFLLLSVIFKVCFANFIEFNTILMVLASSNVYKMQQCFSQNFWAAYSIFVLRNCNVIHYKNVITIVWWISQYLKTAWSSPNPKFASSVHLNERKRLETKK